MAVQKKTMDLAKVAGRIQKHAAHAREALYQEVNCFSKRSRIQQVLSLILRVLLKDTG